MLWMIFDIVLCVTGLIIIIIAMVRFYILINFVNEVAYYTNKHNRRQEFLSFTLMILLTIIFCNGAIGAWINPPIIERTLAMSVHFLGTIFIYGMVKEQGNIAKLLISTRMEVLKTFINAIEMKDHYTKGHSEHVADIVSVFYAYLPEEYQNKLNLPKLLDAALLHDCGKISLQDGVLNKPGKLSQEDWLSIRQHPLNGKRILDDTCFHQISDWVLYHHERVDGKGYYGLRGEEIPLEARIISVADTYSALSTSRIYRDQYSHEKCIELMMLASGTHLDADLVGYFMTIPKKSLEKQHPFAAQQKAA